MNWWEDKYFEYKIGFYIIIFLIIVGLIGILLPNHGNRTKLIDDKKNGVVWIIDEKGDTCGTVQ